MTEQHAKTQVNNPNHDYLSLRSNNTTPMYFFQ